MLFFFSSLANTALSGQGYGLVGGDGGNFAIATATPPSFFLLYFKHQTVHGISLSCFLRLPEASVCGRGA